MTDRLFKFFCSRSLRQYHINYKFHVSVRILTMKIGQWAREDPAVIVKKSFRASLYCQQSLESREGAQNKKPRRDWSEDKTARRDWKLRVLSTIQTLMHHKRNAYWKFLYDFLFFQKHFHCNGSYHGVCFIRDTWLAIYLFIHFLFCRTQHSRCLKDRVRKMRSSLNVVFAAKKCRVPQDRAAPGKIAYFKWSKCKLFI